MTGASSSGIGAGARRGLRAPLAWRVDRLRVRAAELGAERGRTVTSPIAPGRRGRGPRVLERHPRIALLVNNAGHPGRSTFLDADPERIESVLRVNYLGSVWMLRAFRRASSAGAAVVNVVSVAGTVVARLGAVLRLEARAARVLARRDRRAGAARDPRAHDQPRLRRERGLPAAHEAAALAPPRRDRPARSSPSTSSARSSATGARLRPALVPHLRWRRRSSRAWSRTRARGAIAHEPTTTRRARLGPDSILDASS